MFHNMRAKKQMRAKKSLLGQNSHGNAFSREQQQEKEH